MATQDKSQKAAPARKKAPVKAEAVTEKETVKATDKANNTAEAVNERMANHEPIEPKATYEFLEELPNVQQAAPVRHAAEGQKDTRVTTVLEEGQTEPEKVEAEDAIDKTSEETPAAEGKPEPIDPPHEIDVPKEAEYAGGDQTDIRPTKFLEKGEKEPKKVDIDKAIAENDREPDPGRQGGEPVKKDPDVAVAPMPDKKQAKRVAAEPDGKDDDKKSSKPKTTNPKLARLSKYKD